jgi:uncharacterized membrane protein YqjE
MINTIVNKEPATQRKSFTELLGQLVKNSVAVVREEIELVIQRMCEKLEAVRGGVILLAIGAAISFVALMSLCAALIIGLTSYMAPAIAALVTGVLFTLIGIVIVIFGYKQLKKSNL